MSFIVCGQGMQMLVLYGWPSFAQETPDRTQLHSDKPITPPDDVTWTTDRDTGGRAFYKLTVSTRPLTFSDEDAAQYVIDRFQIPDAKPIPWRGL